jgi:hypothetical protein
LFNLAKLQENHKKVLKSGLQCDILKEPKPPRARRVLSKINKKEKKSMFHYSVLVQCKYQEKQNEWTQITTPWTCTTLAEAKKALKDFLKKRNGGARTERATVGSIGILCEIDEETADELTVVHWKIKRRKVTPWELLEEA